MNDVIKYKEYIASINFSAEDEVFHGKILGIKDLVLFEGKSVNELKKAFKESIEDYLETCKVLNKSPEKPYKGSFNVRIPERMHRAAALIASQKSLSLNEFIKTAISYTIKHQHDLDQEIDQNILGSL
jgi:predicted HicB family RNase H-like nuclease